MHIVCVLVCVSVCAFVRLWYTDTARLNIFIRKKQIEEEKKAATTVRALIFTFTLAIIVYALIYTFFCWYFLFFFLLSWLFGLLVYSLPAGKNNHNNNNNHNNRHCNYDTASHCYVCGFDISILDQPICVFGEMTYHDLCSIARLRLLVPPHARAPALSATHWSEMNNKLNYFNAPVSFFSRSSANSRSYCTQQRLFLYSNVYGLVRVHVEFEVSTLGSLKHPA